MKIFKKIRFCCSALVASTSALLLSSCAPSGTDESATNKELIPVVLQTDWFPQPEHGGFYQALAKGFYAEAGLDVTILPGGPNAMTTHKVLRGNAHFAMNRIDTIMTHVNQGMPLIMVMATLQHDPQAIMVRPESPVQSLADLDGATVMAIPGLTWIAYVERKFGISINIIPHDFGMERFLKNPGFIQQCLLTNEPYFVRQQGIEPRVLPLAESGFDPYHGIYCLRSLADDNPELVERFVHASQRGWNDYITSDPQPAFDQIAALNPRMTQDFMEFAWQVLKERQMITGQTKESFVGKLDPTRMQTIHDELLSLGVLDTPLQAEEFYTTRFLNPNPFR